MTFQRIRFILAAPLFITGFFLVFGSAVIMCGFRTACAGVDRMNAMLGPDDVPFA